MATHPNILAWEMPRTEEPSGPQSVGGKESDTTERLRSHSWCFTSPLSESDACSDCKPLMWEDAEAMWMSDQLTRLQKH